MARRRSPDQLDLLCWEPSKPVLAFDPVSVRGASIAVSIAKGVSQALRGCGRTRDDVARLMGEYLDEVVSEHMLNAYASEARSEHIINLVRFVALIHVTRDRRLLELIAAQFDWAVIERRYLPAIEYAERLEDIAERNREADMLRRALKKTGVLK